MGSKNSCQGSRCRAEPYGICKCKSILLCASCFELHKTENPRLFHKFILLKEPPENSDRDQPLTWKSLILLKRIYVTLDSSTEVHEAMIKDRPGKFAIKVMYCRGEQDLKKKQKESQLQMSLKHPGICVCHAAFIDETYSKGYKYVIVMEFSENGDLEEEIERRKLRRAPWSETELLNHITELIEAFAYLQDLNLAHGDIKPRNLYLSGNKIKIGDFGDSNKSMQSLVTRTYQVTGTVIYFSPLLFTAYLDIIKGKNSNGNVRHNPVKSDVYSLGLSLLHMASLVKPTDLNNLENGEDTLQQKIEKIISNLNYSDKIKNLLSGMLQVKESKRYDFKILKECLNPSVQKIQLVEGMQRVSRSSSLRGTDFKIIAVLQSQGKANIYDSSFKVITLNSNKIQYSARAFIYKDSAIISGGLKNSASVFKVQIITGKSTKIQDFCVGRSWHSVVVHQRCVWAVGGRGDNRETLSSCEVLNMDSLDILEEKWVLGPELHVSRENATAVSVKGSIYLFGGNTRNKNKFDLVASIERMTDGVWVLLGTVLEKPASGLGAAEMGEGLILLVGGNREKGVISNETYCFDTSSSVLTKQVCRLSEPDCFSSQCSAVLNENIYFMGSLIGSHVYDEVAKTFYLKPY